jgi:branched-chain amino acid transport system substrate-binding protein
MTFAHLARASAALMLVITMSGCGTGGNSTAKQPGNVQGPDGTPIVLYDITDFTGLGAVSSAISQFNVGELVAQDYINAGGGVGGRPIKVLTCDSRADPAATTACAQAAVDVGAVAKIGLSVAWGENGFPVLKRAGIPSLNPPVNPQDMKDGEGSFVTGGAGEYEAQVKYAGDVMHAKTMVVFTDDNPTGQDQVNRVRAAIERYGYDMQVTPIYLPVGTADPAPFVAKAIRAKPDVIMTNQSGAQAVSAYTAFRQQRFPADRILNQGGAADFESFFDKVPHEVANGAIFAYAFENPDNLSDPDVKRYRELMEKYAGREGKSEFYQWGFSNVVLLASIAEEIGPDRFDAATLKEYLLHVEDHSMYMARPIGRKFATVDAPAMIRPDIQVLRFQDGKLETVMPWFNPYAHWQAP